MYTSIKKKTHTQVAALDVNMNMVHSAYFYCRKERNYKTLVLCSFTLALFLAVWLKVSTVGVRSGNRYNGKHVHKH